MAFACIVLLPTMCMAHRNTAEKWTNFQSWAMLQRGMTKTQVVRFLGEPKETTACQTGRKNVWYYQQVPKEQTNQLTDGSIVFKQNRTGVYILFRWQDPSWKQVEADKKEKEAEIEAAALKVKLEREVALTQQRLERAEKAKKALELKEKRQEEVNRRKAEREEVAKARALEDEEEAKKHTLSSGLDHLFEIVTEGHLIRNGLILLGVVFVFTLIFKSAAGKFWWRHSKKPPNIQQNRYNQQKYSMSIIDIPEKKSKETIHLRPQHNQQKCGTPIVGIPDKKAKSNKNIEVNK